MSFWTVERVEQITRFWNEGKSASEIADLMGEVSRSAVIGKAHRLGLSARPDPIKYQQVYARIRHGKREIITENRAAIIAFEVARVVASEQPLGTNTERTCEWPFGTGPYTYCGAKRVPGRPYCGEHCAKAYKKLPPRVRKGANPFTHDHKGNWS